MARQVRGVSLSGALSGARAALSRGVPGDPREPGSPEPQTGKPIQPAPPASEVPAPAPTMFDKPLPKVTWPMKKTASLKSVSEAIANLQVQSGTVPLLDDDDLAEPGETHVKTTGAVEHDLSQVSQAIGDMKEEEDSSGED
jgi:hypothetical protein